MVPKVLAYSSLFSVIIPIACYLLSKKKNRISKILFILLLASLFADVGNITYLKSGFKGYIIPNIFFIAQTILLSIIYYLLLREKKIVFVMEFIFLIFCAFNFAFFQNINESQSLLWLLGDTLILAYAIQYYQGVYKLMPIENITQYSPIWINNAVLYYFSLNFFLFAAANYIFKNEPPEVGMVFWSFHNFNNIVKNCLFAVAIYYGGRLKKKLS